MRKPRQDRNNLDEIDALIHESIFNASAGNIPRYSSDLALAMSAAEKVSLFDTIILEKASERYEDKDTWNTIRKPTPDNPRLEAVSMGFTPAEAIARGCLVLKAQKNEQSNRTDQHSFGSLTKTCS